MIKTYYAEEGEVWKRSMETKSDDGSSSFSFGFRVCEVEETVGEDGPNIIAKLMNRGEQAEALVAALGRAEQKLAAYVGVCTGDTELTNTILPMVRAAIEQYRG